MRDSLCACISVSGARVVRQTAGLGRSKEVDVYVRLELYSWIAAVSLARDACPLTDHAGRNSRRNIAGHDHRGTPVIKELDIVYACRHLCDPISVNSIGDGTVVVPTRSSPARRPLAISKC